MDADLVRRAQHGDEDAFSALATSMFTSLHRVAENILNDIDLAEDAAQQAVLSMWRSLPRLRDPERFEAWSYRILVNACYSEAKRTKHWMPRLALGPEDDSGVVEQFSGVLYRDELDRGFRRLPVDQRSVVVLHHYLDLPLREVAEVLGIPLGTVHSRLNRAMSSLRAALEADARLPIPDAPEREVV